MSAGLFGGAALGLIGNVLQANAQSDANDTAYNRQLAMRNNSIPLLLALGGGANASTLGRTLLDSGTADYLFGTNPQVTAAQQARIRELQGELATLGQPRGSGWMANREQTALQRTQAASDDARRQALNTELQTLIGKVKNAQPGVVNAAELDKAAALLPSAQYAKIASQQEQSGLGQLGRYDTETQNMLRMLQGSTDAQKAQVNTQSNRDLLTANRLASQRLSRAGAGASTLLSGALAQNSGQIGERRNNTLSGIDQGLLQQQLGIMGNRSQQRLGLETGLNGVNLGLRTAPLDQQMAILSNIGNSGLGTNSYQPINGISPIGTGLQTLGNSLSAWGGTQSLGGGTQAQGLNTMSGQRDQWGNLITTQYGPQQQ